MQAHNNHNNNNNSSSLTSRQNNASNQNYINSNGIGGVGVHNINNNNSVAPANRLAHMHSQATNRNGASASLGGVGGGSHGSQPVVVIPDSIANGSSGG